MGLTDHIFLVLPRPPSSNERAAVAPVTSKKTGKRKYRIISSDEQKRWMEEAGWQLKIQKMKGLGQIKGPYRIDFLVEPMARKADVWNYEKLTSDLLVAHEIVEDDHLAEGGTIWWDRTGEVKGISVSITAMEREDV